MNAHHHIVLICVDQWRGDCLSIAGHPVVHTPYLDELALDGTRFTQAYAAAPSCIAARASLYTGLTPRTHGRVGYADGVTWNYDTYIADAFARAGYHTQAVGKLHVYPQRSLIGFHNVVLFDGYVHFSRREFSNQDLVDDYLPWLRAALGREADEIDHGVDCNSATVARPWDKPEHTHPTNFTVTESIRFLERRDPTKPFFLFMSFHRPHPPLDPPGWAFDQYINAEMPDPPIGDWVDYFAPNRQPHRPNTGVGPVDPRWLRRARAGYYGHMTHIDHQIKRFRETLDAMNLTSNTTLAFVSDHGELLGDHHLFRKTLPYDGSARIPLIIRPAPSMNLAPRVVPEVVELRDIMPTLLDCAGVPIPSCVEGKSMLPLIRGEVRSEARADSQTAWRQYLHGEHTIGGIPASQPAQSVHYLTDGHEKYVWFSGDGHEQFFDLDADPQERRDLARSDAAAARIASWRLRLIEELRDREEGFTDGKRLNSGRPVSPVLKAAL